jgi:hypothetical protein
MMFIFTQGSWTPAGVFMPGMVIGSGLGICVHGTMALINPNQNPLLGSSYQIMGAAAFLASYTR